MIGGGHCGGKAASAAGLRQHLVESAAFGGDIADPLYTCQISGLNDINLVVDLATHCTAALMDEVLVDLSWMRVKGNRAKERGYIAFRLFRIVLEV